MTIPLRRRRSDPPTTNSSSCRVLAMSIVLVIFASGLLWHLNRSMQDASKYDNDDLLTPKQKQQTEISLLRISAELSSSKKATVDQKMVYDEHTRAAHIQLKLADVSSLELLRQRGTPQNHAYSWLIDDDGLHVDLDKGDTNSHLIQRYILALLYFTLGGPQWKHSDVFLKEQQHECHWMFNDGEGTGHHQGRMGVLDCNQDMEITNLFLVENNLAGSLPSELRYLSKLTNLDLQHNQLQGDIPESLGYITTLNYLGLSKNQFEGTVPITIGGIDALEQLLVYGNKLKGTVPESICKLKTTGVFFNLWADCSKSATTSITCDCCSVCCDEQHKCNPVENKKKKDVVVETTTNNNNKNNKTEAEIPAVIAAALEQKKEEGEQATTSKARLLRS